MRKIVVISLQNVRNYGSALQAFATQKKLEEYGLNVEFINYKRRDMKDLYSRLRNWVKNDSVSGKIVKCFVLFPTFAYQEFVFKRFLKKYITMQDKVCIVDEDFKGLPIDADIYCTGSDQVWNSTWNLGILEPLFLSFVPDHIPKIAYSASFGKHMLDDSEKEVTRKLLQRYRHISVRESSGVDIIDDLGIKNATHVLDPTLQMSRAFWEKYAGKSRSNEPYVLIYQLNSNREFDKYAKEFARRKGMKLIRFCTRLDQLLLCGFPAIIPDVFGFVSYIFHAEYVITDSFHATAFSINVNTDFISIYPKEFSTRIESILRLTNLQNRHLKSYEDFSYVDLPPTDFSHVNIYLEKERERGEAFLNKALSINNIN